MDMDGIPVAYSPCTRDSLLRYIQDMTSFIQSPLVASLIASHPNQTVLLEEDEFPEAWRGWLPFFDALGAGEAYLYEEPEEEPNLLKSLIQSGNCVSSQLHFEESLLTSD